MDLKTYREHIKRLASNRDGEGVYNGSADHAAIIVENMFNSARCNVRLLTGDLNAKVYGSERVVQRAKQFLGHSDHRLDVLVEDVTFSGSHPLIEEIGDGENVSFYKIPRQMSDELIYHFMTADEDCFRFEREKNSHAAVAAFGDGETSKHLNDIFDGMKAECGNPLDMSEYIE